MTTIQVIGGGIAGMVAAITAAEADATVEVCEAHEQLGGRARSLAGDWAANWGPHALYNDGPLWAWLGERHLIPAVRRPAMGGLRFRCDGAARRTPPRYMLRSAGLLRARSVPVDRSFHVWAAQRYGERAATRWANAAGVATFCHDPGALSAAFVVERLRRVFGVPPAARFPVGGWSSLVDRLEARMRDLGVRVRTGVTVDRLGDLPVIVALAPAAARRLLSDDTVAWPGARTALLDVGMRARHADAYIVSDLDQAGWAERFSRRDRSLAPTGHSLVQAQIGLRPGESLDGGIGRIEAVLDVGFAGWRERETWRRRAVVEGQSGALDMPGYRWQDRPAIDRGDGVWLCGDYVAAPGLLAEVAWASAVAAGRAAAVSRASSSRRASHGSSLHVRRDARSPQ